MQNEQQRLVGCDGSLLVVYGIDEEQKGEPELRNKFWGSTSRCGVLDLLVEPLQGNEVIDEIGNRYALDEHHRPTSIQEGTIQWRDNEI